MEAHRYSLLARHGPSALVAFGTTPDASRTAADLHRDVAALTAALSGPPGARPVLAINDRYLFAAALLACWQSGRAAALPPNGQPETLAALAANQGGILLHDGNAPHGLDVREVLANAKSSSAAGEPGPLSFDADRQLVVIFTSGTTGPQQACEKSAAQLLGEVELHARMFDLGDGDRILATVPPQHIYGLLWGLLLPLSCGAAFARSTPLHAESVAAVARETGASFLISVPAHLRGLDALADDALPGIGLVFSSGAALDARTLAILSRLKLPTREILGSTETGGIASRDPFAGQRWRALPGVHVDADEEGRLLLDSPFVERKAARPLPCADRIELALDGSFTHLGRLDDVVKVAGKRLSIAELVSRLREIPGVEDAAAFALTTEAARGADVYAVVAGKDLTIDLIRAQLGRALDPSVLPRHLRIVEKLPVAENGKPNRAALLALFERAKEIDPDPEHKRLVLAQLSRETSDAAETVLLQGSLPPELYWFRGHFDGAPILAGVVQLRILVLNECRRVWPDLRGLRRLARVKFRQPLRASETISLKLRRETAAHSVSYDIQRNGRSCSSGTLEFESGNAR